MSSEELYVETIFSWDELPHLDYMYCDMIKDSKIIMKDGEHTICEPLYGMLMEKRRLMENTTTALTKLNMIGALARMTSFRNEKAIAEARECIDNVILEWERFTQWVNEKWNALKPEHFNSITVFVKNPTPPWFLPLDETCQQIRTIYDNVNMVINAPSSIINAASEDTQRDQQFEEALYVTKQLRVSSYNTSAMDSNLGPDEYQKQYTETFEHLIKSLTIQLQTFQLETFDE